MPAELMSIANYLFESGIFSGWGIGYIYPIPHVTKKNFINRVIYCSISRMIYPLHVIPAQAGIQGFKIFIDTGLSLE